ncbi:hypothetical protein TGME49_248720 [Toxoplasma gondii ME49]|uniref:Uncharacterized protein n=2 Tax=Toxoplasma gondii TaxID=5811 RepID=B6KH95_TOXGV|nr:hypothetical protein TGME49_248720 [Toxoplasma gondii ME49]EPT25038.1 hypothetical protein TGME49_248720 [Toxoplasma gondii ME49]ESS34255.1 hypothetical protein TGVEG_248720 [Toxoplasma gondii VEG]CEL78495.1 TPA: hypothetical protein BN1205_003070 [Toxoplasma gondii VEG]|eukprot:XP_002367218.1 hypothetical protein TGME49_248720 [Toxoplasma gondii ME49]
MKCREASPANSSSSPYCPAFLGPPVDASGGLPPTLSVSSAAGRSDGADEDLSLGTSSFVDSAVSTACGRDGDSREPTGEDEAPKSDPQRVSPSLEPNETVNVEPDVSPLTWDKGMSSYPPPLPSPGTGSVADIQRVSLANEEELKAREFSGVVKDGDDEQERTSCRDREEQSLPHVSPQLSPWVCENGADEVRGESLYLGMSLTPDHVTGRDSNGDPVLLFLPTEAETLPGASVSFRPDSQACSSSLETHSREQETVESSRVLAKAPADAAVSDYRPRTTLDPNMPAAAPTEAGTTKTAKLAAVGPVLPAESSESGKDEGSMLVGGQRRRGGLAPQQRRSSRVAVSAVDDTTPPQSLAWWMVCWPPSEESSDPFSDVASLQKPASSKDPQRRDSSLFHDLPSGNAESCAFVPLAADAPGRRTSGAGGEGRDPRGEGRSLSPPACEAQTNGNWSPERRRCGGAHATEEANGEAGESDLFSSEFAAFDDSEETLRPVPFSFCPSRREAKNDSREDSPARRSLSPPSRWRQHLEEQLSMEIPPPEWLRDPYSRRPRLVSDALWARPSRSGETGVFCGGPPPESERDCCSRTCFGGAGHETVQAPLKRRRGRATVKARRVPNTDLSPAFPERGETAGPPFESGFPSRSPFAPYPDASRLPLLSRGESRSGPERSMSPPCSRRDDAGRLRRDSGAGAGGSDRGSAVAWGPGAGLGFSETRGRGGPSRGPLPRSRRDASVQPVPGPPLTVRDLIAPRVGTCCCGPTGVCPMCQRTKRGLHPAVSSSTARRETAAAFAAAADELLIADGLPPGSYTPAALGSLGTRDVSLALVERFLGSLLGGDTRLGDLTAPGFHLAWMAYHFLRRLSATSRLPWGLGHAKGPRATFGTQGPAGKAGKSDPTGLHQPPWTERGRRPSPAGGAKGEGPKGGGGPRDLDGARAQAKGVQLKQRGAPTPRPLRSVQGGGHRERDHAGVPSTGTRGEVGPVSLAKRETLERAERGTAAVEGPRLSGVNSGGLAFASANLGSSRAVSMKIEDKSGRAERRTKREESVWGFAQMRNELPLEDAAKEHGGKRRGATQPDMEADDETRGLEGPLWQTNFGFVDSEWPRFVCGTIDRRWALQQCNLSVSLNVEPSPRPASPASGASRGPGAPRGGSRSSPSTVRAVGDKDSRSVSSPFPSLSTGKQKAERGAREKSDKAEKRGPKSPASSQNPSLSALASPVEGKPEPAGVSTRALTASPPAPSAAAPSEGVSPGSRPPASPLGDTSGPSSPLRSSAVPAKGARGDTVDKPKGEKKKGRGSTPGKETAGRTPGGSTAGYEVAVQFEEFPFSAAEWMWPKPLDLPETLTPGLEVQVAIEVRGRFAQWWVDAVVESVSSDGVRCLLTTEDGCLPSLESERGSVSASPPICSRRPTPGLQDAEGASTSIRENRDTSSPFADVDPKPEASGGFPLGHTKKRTRPGGDKEERSAASKLPVSLVKRERSEHDSEGPRSAESDVERVEAASVERREDSGGVDYFGPRSDQGGLCGQASEGGAEEATVENLEGRVLSGDGVETKMTDETELLAHRKDIEGSPEEICVGLQDAHAEQMGSARRPMASSLSDFSAHNSLAVKNSQTKAENDSKEEEEEKEQEKGDQERKEQERGEREEDEEERREACEPHAKRVKRETSPRSQREDSRLSTNPRLVGERATPTKQERKEEEGNSGDEYGKADAGRVKQRASKTPISRGRPGRSAGGKGAFLERLKAPHVCQLRQFLAPQVPAAAPLSRSWRLRPRPLDPEKDLHPGAVLCVSASAASLHLGLPSQHSPQPSPPFFMRDAVVHRVFFGSDRPSAARGPSARASGEEGADSKPAEAVGGQEGSEECKAAGGGRRRGCFPTGIVETQTACVRGEAEDEQGMLSQVKKPTEMEGHTPRQDQGQRDEMAASREGGAVVFCGEISGDRTKGDIAVGGVSAGVEDPETKESVSKSNSVSGSQLAMHVQAEPGAGAPRRASVSGLRLSPPGRSPAFGDGAHLATDEEGKNKEAHASEAVSDGPGAPSSDQPTTRKTTRSLGVARSQLSPASQGESRREKETPPQSRRGVGGAGAGAEGNLIGRRRDKRLDEGSETKKADESRATTHPASSSVACYDGVRPSERVTFVHLYFPYGNQQRIVSVEQLRKCACYRLPYDLHAHFPPESTQTVLRQAHDFLWAIPRALPLVPTLTRAKRATRARRGARGPGLPPRGDSRALSQGVASARETPEVSDSGFGADACVDVRDKEVWDEATDAPTREWSESPPFCMVYAALEDSPFRLPQHLQLVQLLQPELDFDALLGGTWRLRFPQWKPPAAPLRLERPLSFALPSEAPFPRLLHHPSEGPPAAGALTVSLPAWRRLRGWAPYPMDLSAASSAPVAPSHAVTQKVAEEPAQPSQAAGTDACTGTQEADMERATIKDEQRNDVASSAPPPEEAHRLRSRKTETMPGVKQLDCETSARSNIRGEELEPGKTHTGHTLSQASSSAASLPPFPVRSLSLPAAGDVGQPESEETAHIELEDVFASGVLPWATVETLEGAQVDASGRWTSSALYLYEKLLFASWAQRQRVAAFGNDACMRFTAPYRSVAEDIVEPTRSLWGVFSLPSDFEECETVPEVVGDRLVSSGVDRPIQLDIQLGVPASPDTSPKAEKPGKQTLQSRLGTQTGLSCSERRPVRLGRTPTKLEGSANASRVGPETARAGATRRTSPGSAPAWTGEGGLAFSRRPRLPRASAGSSFLERERAGSFNAVYGQFPQPQGGLVRMVRDPEPPHPIFWDTETDEPPSRRPSTDNASLETVSGPSRHNSKAADMCEIAFDEDSARGQPAGPTHGFTATDCVDSPTGSRPSDLTEQVRCKRPLVETETCDAGAALQVEASHTKIARHQLAADSSLGSGQAWSKDVAGIEASGSAGRPNSDLRERDADATFPAEHPTLQRANSRGTEKSPKTGHATTGLEDKRLGETPVGGDDGEERRMLSSRRRTDSAHQTGELQTPIPLSSLQESFGQSPSRKAAELPKRNASQGITVSPFPKGQEGVDTRGTRKRSEAGTDRNQRNSSHMRGSTAELR